MRYAKAMSPNPCATLTCPPESVVIGCRPKTDHPAMTPAIATSAIPTPTYMIATAHFASNTPVRLTGRVSRVLSVPSSASPAMT